MSFENKIQMAYIQKSIEILHYKIGFKPRQFHCTILCLKSILENNIKRGNKIMVRLNLLFI